MTNAQMAIAVLNQFRKLASENAALQGVMGNLRRDEEPLDWQRMTQAILEHPSFQDTVRDKYDQLEQSILRATDQEAPMVLLLGLLEN